MTIDALLDSFAPEIDDPEEEAFILFSQSIPSQNLGFVDSKATLLDLTIGERDLIIHQSPTILSSTRGGGTTGAVVWKITPLFAAWIGSPRNLFFSHEVFCRTSTVIELGCGISGIISLTLAPLIESYTLTDQEYVMKLLNRNLLENTSDSSSSANNRGRKSTSKSRKLLSNTASADVSSNITVQSLDWETDEVSASLAGQWGSSFDAVIACDCIYNDTLIRPLVQTCIDICKLREAGPNRQPTMCIIAQQLRSAEVFDVWLKTFHVSFRVWRVPDADLIPELQSNSGFVVHVGILREY